MTPTAAQALEALRDKAESFFEWPGENRDVVTLTSAILFARHVCESAAAEIAALRVATASVQADQRAEVDRLRAEVEGLSRDAARYRELRNGDNRLAVCDEDGSYFGHYLDAKLDELGRKG